ncbi:MAG: aromatic amino acid transport family protein [Patescibacteria group bacterium]
MKKKLFGLATLTSTVIGVGIFGLPYIAKQSGFLVVVFYLMVIGTVSALVHLLFGEVALRTKERHRLPGYAERYLGSWGKRVTVFSTVLSLLGSVLVYIIIGGEFLHGLLVETFGGSTIVYTLIVFTAGALLIYFGTRSIASTAFYLLVIFFVAIIVLFIFGAPKIDPNNLMTFFAENSFLPYGVVLFALWGVSIIPEIKEIMRGQEKHLSSVIIGGITLSVLTYFIFTFLILGITGEATTEEAISGLQNVWGGRIIYLGFIFGLLTTFTSFLTLGLTLKKVFWYDFKIPHLLSWAITVFVPLAMFFMGLKNFINIIAIIGAIMLAVEAIVVILIFLKAKTKGKLKPAYEVKIPNWASYTLIVLLLVGIIYQIIYEIGKLS